MLPTTTLFLAAVFFGTAISQTADPYTSWSDYQGDISDCISKCYGDIWLYNQNTCNKGTDWECVCMTPIPDLEDPQISAVYNTVRDCAQKCPKPEQTTFDEASQNFNESCSSVWQTKGQPSTVGHEYYQSVMSTLTLTGSYPAPTGTTTGSASSQSTSANATGGSGAETVTSTGNSAERTGNAADLGAVINWGLVGMVVLGAGAQLL